MILVSYELIYKIIQLNIKSIYKYIFTHTYKPYKHIICYIYIYIYKLSLIFRLVHKILLYIEFNSVNS